MANKEYHKESDLMVSIDEMEAMEIDKLFNNAVIYFNMGHSESMFTSFYMFQKVIEKNPDYLAKENGDNAYFYLGLMYYNNLNDLDVAIENFSKATELDPTDGYSFVNRGYCWSDKGEFEKALADLKMAKLYNGDEFDPEIDLKIQDVEKHISKKSI